MVAMAPASPHPAWCFTVDAEGFARPFGDGSGLRARSQDLPVAYSLTGSLYVMGIADFLREETFFTPATRALVTETPLHAIDIDDKFDWLVAEAFANQVRPLEQP